MPSSGNNAQSTVNAPRQTPQERAAATRKRKYDTFVQEGIDETSVKGRSYKTLKPFYQAGLWWPQGICLYSDISMTLVDGIKDGQRDTHEEEEDEEDDGADVSKPSEIARARNVHAFTLFAQRYPELLELFYQTIEYEDSDTFDRMVTTIMEGYKQARRTDTNRIKDDICDWFLRAMKDSTNELDDFSFEVEPISRTDLKSERGVHHPLTRAFLIPFDYMGRVYLQSDGVEACNKVFSDLKKGSKRLNKKRRKGKKGKATDDREDETGIPLESASLCAFLYSINDYDPEKMWSGLFRGPLLIFAYRAIFTSPSSALGEKSAPTKSGNAKIHGVFEVSVESIAYVSAQVRFALCTKHSWTKEDGVFNLEAFYFFVLDLMLKAPPQWREDLLEFWNDAVFGDTSDSFVLDKPKAGSNMAVIMQQFTRDFSDANSADPAAEDPADGASSSA
ncbi:hypothetical protein K435DRAFT_842780 [Dendrothele bispora CBS 962.96]|uniref:Uncharacterized protein n=1 Tax=Dendrothele bispora (strain CBS 962.96) TaxID=1314807 RepID=A0A4S8LCY6_DENBC|nr:hypothetical protein K435DRAFT_842780 [Dendrothele bispora CBS 962.96]